MSEKLKILASRKEAMEHVFPNMHIQRSPKWNYLYRAEISRKALVRMTVNRLEPIDCKNFEASVAKLFRRRIFMGVDTGTQTAGNTMYDFDKVRKAL